ncbi:capsule assembly Wzi family protein [Pseudoalteromonas fenneropenaei]|uniref:Capsule assembly Wzi family protein n=1 Tax=Pseudoalteromonas fenneropenaei TaxID=1737459 RepID=A0ABV7CFU3_9GAMM
MKKRVCLVPLLAALMLPTAFAAPTAYLPLGSDPLLEYQVEQLFALTTGTPSAKPYRLTDIHNALRHARTKQPALYDAIVDKLKIYNSRDAVVRQGVELRVKNGETHALGNDRGNTSAEYAQLSFEGIWRGSENTLMQVGLEYRVKAAELVPYNTFVAYSLGNVQVDLGYKEHWLSPFKHFAQVYSNNAEPSPSVSLGLVSPLHNWWNLDIELFYSELDHVEDGFYHQGQVVSGTPQLAGTRLHFEPVEGWTIGFNRIMQFGGGPRDVSVKDVFKAFFDPAGQDNRDLSGGTFDSELGDQWATITSHHQFTEWFNGEIYFEYGGEDTKDHKNYQFGNLAINAGVYLPTLTDKSSLRYEYSNMHSRWYTNELYFKNGNTIDGFVVGSFIADSRVFGDDNPSKAHILEWVYNSSLSSQWRLKYTTIAKENVEDSGFPIIDFTYQHRAHELEIVRNERWQDKQVEAKLAVGKDVFGENYSWLSLNIYW